MSALRRLTAIPRRMSRCVLCGHVSDCTAYDHDLRGDLCEGRDGDEGCEDAVRNAEDALALAGLVIPTASILEEGGAL